MKTYQVDKNGYYGEFGGAYVPEILHQCVENLQNTYLQVLESDSFKEEFDQLLRDYVGRPLPSLLGQTVEREIRMQYLFETGRLEPYRST